MPSYHSQDYSFLARRRSAPNHLKNGNFSSIPRQYTGVHRADLGAAQQYGISQVKRTDHVYKVTWDNTNPPGPTNFTYQQLNVPGVSVESAVPSENYIGYWDVRGVTGRLAFSEENQAFESGHLVTVSFSETGTINFRQTIESYDKFRGRPITMSLGCARGDRRAIITFIADVGTEQITSRVFSSDYFGQYLRVADVLNIPLDINKFDLTIQIEGVVGSSVGISGAMLALGGHIADTPYCDSISDVALPSGSVIMFVGESCPDGFRSIEESSYIMPTFGDPNAPKGDLWFNNRLSLKNGTLDSLGPDGDHVLGGNSHQHNQRAGTGSFITTGFPDGYAFRKGGVAQASVDPDQTTGSTEDVKLSLDDPAFAGGLAKILTPGHQHTVNYTDDDIDPPHINVRICEKI